MVSVLWWIPLAIGAAAVPMLWLARRRLAAELRRLGDTTSTLGQVAPALAEVRRAALSARRRLEDLGRQ